MTKLRVLVLAFMSVALLPHLGCGYDLVEQEPTNLGSNSGGGPVTIPPPPEGFEPAYSYSFSNLTGGTGSSSKYLSPGVETDSLLKVRIIAGNAGAITTPGYENWQVTYGCLAYKVTLFNVNNGQTIQNGSGKDTITLAAQGGDNSLCPSAPEYEVIDFSNRVNGADQYKIQVSTPRYDAFCKMWWEAAYPYGPYFPPDYEYATYYVGNYSQVCPLKAVQSMHSVSGALEILVNGQYLDE